jgi:hypothetical protein
VRQILKERRKQLAKLCNKVLCPVCGQYGFLSKRWVRSSYYPKYYTSHEYHRDKSTLRGSRYRGELLKSVYSAVEQENEQEQHKESLKRVTYRKRIHTYVGHYDEAKYKVQMIKFRQGLLKSKPNGRKWCHVQSTVDFYTNAAKAPPGYYHPSLPEYCQIAYIHISRYKPYRYGYNI